MSAVITLAQAHAMSCLFMAADGLLARPADDRARAALDEVASQFGFENWLDLFHYKGSPQVVEAVLAADYLVSPDQGDEVINCDDEPLKAALEEFAQKVLAAREGYNTFSEDQVQQMVEGAFAEGWQRRNEDLAGRGPDDRMEHDWKESEAKRQLELHLSETEEQDPQPEVFDSAKFLADSPRRRLEEDDCA